MNPRRMELGSLATRFFAYVQMRQQDVVRTGDIRPVLGITASQERDLFRRLSESGWIVRLTRGVYLVPPRIPAGGRYSPGVALVLQKLMEELQGRCQVCGPTAFNFHGLDDQVSTVTYAYNNRLSGHRIIGSLAFRFIKVAEKRLGATICARSPEGTETVYSSETRTLMDAVYDWSRFDSLPRGFDWIQRRIADKPALAKELVTVTSRYGNQATIRRIGYVLDALARRPSSAKELERSLSDSRSLIPWIPNKPARGTINRKWGVIVNG